LSINVYIFVSSYQHLHLAHLEARMRQSGHWNQKESLTKEVLLKLLRNKIAHLNVQAAINDIIPLPLQWHPRKPNLKHQIFNKNSGSIFIQY